MTFPAWPESIPAARRYVDELLGDRAELSRTAALLVSELVTNAVRHAAAPVVVVDVRAVPDERRLWVGVTDSGAGFRVLRTPRVTMESGRGIQLVSTVADRWVRAAAGPARTRPCGSNWTIRTPATLGDPRRSGMPGALKDAAGPVDLDR